MAFITVKVTGDVETINRLQKLGKSFLNFKLALDKIGEELESYFGNQVFASQGGAIDESWPALSPKYQAWKSKHFPGRGPLIQTGKMQDSFTHRSTASYVEVDNSAPYFKYHQSTLPRQKIPRRAMMGINDPVKSIISDIINADMRKKISQAGL